MSSNNWNNERSSYAIGIDTGVNTGLAIWDRKKKIWVDIKTLPIHRAMEQVLQYKGHQVIVRIEDARLRKWIPKQKNEKWERGVREGAGSVKRDASIWEDFLTDHKIPFELVAPKNNKTKLKKEVFARYVNYTGLTSEHSRDAAMLVYQY